MGERSSDSGGHEGSAAEAFAGHYVISVNGIPLMGAGPTRSGDEDDANTARHRELDDLDRVKGLSSLEARGRDPVQAGLVTPGGHRIELLFGFCVSCCRSRCATPTSCLRPQMGRVVVKVHFSPKEMQYHGELAV